MKDISSIDGYVYTTAEQTAAHGYLWPQVESIVREYFAKNPNVTRSVFDLGCGNGAIAALLAQQGYAVQGVDPSEEGIRQAVAAYPELDCQVGSAYEELCDRFGRFSVVVSLEVVEHVYDPRHFARTLAGLLSPGGIAIISTPYHSYLKNVVLAITGNMDSHYTALWDHGHIKFWSYSTLSTLLEESGLKTIEFYRVGRIPILAKSMILVASNMEEGPR